MTAECATEDCHGKVYYSGICSSHYYKRQRARKVAQAVPCSVNGCGRVGMTQGLCYAHYQRKRKTGDVGSVTLRQEEPIKACSVPGCGEPNHARGLCGTHYMRVLTTGEIGDARLKPTSNRSPFQIGSRPLVAKTCTLCGLLLDREWFSDSKSGSRKNGSTYCRKCQSDRQDREAALMRGRAYQITTVSSASNNRKEWTEADYKVLTDPTKSWDDKARELGRTHYAMRHKIQRIGLAIPRGGFPTEGAWRIFWEDRA